MRIDNENRMLLEKMRKIDKARSEKKRYKPMHRSYYNPNRVTKLKKIDDENKVKRQFVLDFDYF